MSQMNQNNSAATWPGKQSYTCSLGLTPHQKVSRKIPGSVPLSSIV